MKITINPKIVLLFIIRLLGLFKLSRYLTKSQLRILCYHGGLIGDEDHYNPKLFCSSKTLQTRMQWMKARGFQFVTLDDGVIQQASPSAKTPLRAVVTFDDGWHSTASELLPVLNELQIPSTLYLSTKNFLEGWPILAVTVRYTIWKAGQRSVSLHGWGTEVDGKYDLRNADERNRLTNCIVPAIERSASSRQQVCDALGRFADELGVGAMTLQLDSRRFDYMTPQKLLEISKQRCSIELHGHVHRYSKGNPTAFVEDLRQCVDTIVGLGLRQPRHYCYPSGSFSAEATVALSEMGIRSATTCVPGLINKIGREHCHYLPRFMDGENVHPLEFEAEISGFLELLRDMFRFFRERFSMQAGIFNDSPVMET